MTCRAPNYSICIVQGATYRQRLRISGRSGAVTTPADVSLDTFELYAVDSLKRALVSMTSAGGQVTIVDGPGGIIELTLSKTATAALSPVRGKYDLFWSRSNGERVRILSGVLDVVDTTESSA